MPTYLIIYYCVCAAMCALGLWLHHASKKRMRELKQLNATMERDRAEREKAWTYTHPVIRGHVRDRMLFNEAARNHIHAFPGDLKCVWSLIRTQDGFNINCLLPGGDGAIKAWNDAHGQQAMRHLAEALGHVERHQPGLLAPLAVMLDEQRDLIREEAANDVIHRTTN